MTTPTHTPLGLDLDRKWRTPGRPLPLLMLVSRESAFGERLLSEIENRGTGCVNFSDSFTDNFYPKAAQDFHIPLQMCSPSHLSRLPQFAFLLFNGFAAPKVV